MIKNVSRLFGCSMIMLLFASGQPAAKTAVIDQIAGDFSPLSGYVVMAHDAEYIIDMDAGEGFKVGDLFSVIGPGKKITHPKTGKLLGTLEEVKAILKVTRIKPGFSFARPVGKASGIKRGDPIRRYSHIPAIFWDYTESGKPFYADLQSALPELDWQDYETSQRTRPSRPEATSEPSNSLFFILSDQGVEVRDSDFFVLHTYSLPESVTLKSVTPSTTPEKKRAAVATPKVSKKAAPKEAPKEPGLIRLSSEGVQTLGRISPGTVMADFIEYDNQLLMATTDGLQIEVYAVSDEVRLVAKANQAWPGQILAVSWWLPPGEEHLYLAASAWQRKRINGKILRFSGNKLETTHDNLHRILGAFDLDGDNKPETLLGQRFEAENFFGTSIKMISIAGGKASLSSLTFPLPRRFTVTGSSFLDLNGDGQLETAFLRNGILNIFNQNEQIYRSPKKMGGTLSHLSYVIEPGMQAEQTTNAYFEIPPVAEDLDGDGQLEILSVASERTVLGTVAPSRQISRSWLAVVKYKDGRYVDGILGNEMSTSVQGLKVNGDRVLFVATELPSFLGRTGSSHLLAYSLR